MTPTRPWTLLAVAAVCALAAWLAVRSSAADLPTLSGRNLRAKLMGRRDGKPFAPIAVTRMAALAKASSLGGAAFGGLAAGLFVYSAGLLNLAVPRGDAINAGITAVAAGLLVIAALYLERCCRAPKSDRDDPE